MYVPTPSAPPSPQVMDLGQRIAATVRTYLAENPGIDANEVTQSFTVARKLVASELGGLSQQTVAILVSAVLGVVVLGVFVFLNFGGGWNPETPMVTLLVAIIAIGAVFVIISKKGL